MLIGRGNHFRIPRQHIRLAPTIFECYRRRGHMKNPLFLLLSLSLLSCSGDKDNPNLEKSIKMETVFTYTFSENFGEYSPQLDTKDTYKYDSHGNKVEWSNYDSKGELNYKVIYRYDSSGNKIERLFYRKDGTLGGKYFFKYDTNGNEIEQFSYDSSEQLSSKQTSQYDSLGHKIEALWYRSPSASPNKFVYSYDANGNMIEFLSMSSDGKIYRKETYKYDSDGNKIEEVSTTPKKGASNTIKTYRYDSSGNMIEELTYSLGWDLFHKKLKKYNSDNNPIELMEYYTETKFGETIDEPDKKITYEYEFY